MICFGGKTGLSRIKDYINDYKVNLIAPGNIEDFSKFRTEIGQVLEFVKASKSEDETERLLQENEKYQTLSGETVSAINVFTGMNVPVREEEKVMDMCKAWKDHLQRGRREEIFESVQAGDYPPERGAEKLNISVEELVKRMEEEGYKVPVSV